MKSVGVKELKTHSTEDNTNQMIEAYLDKLQGEGKLNRATRFRSLIGTFQYTGKVSNNIKWKNIYSKIKEDRY